MTNRGAATRYARALFDTTLAEGLDLEQTQKDLGEFARLVAGNDALQRVLTNPAIPVARKRGVIEQLIQVIARSGSLQPTLGKLLLMLAERDRLVILPDVAHVFDVRLMEHQNVVRARIVTAVALSPDRVTALAAGLTRATGRNVQVETQVDPAIIGGAVARIGGTVYDGSITRQLERIRESLAGTTD
jgi:F-type H+-transporting ATPase subunit delta